MSDSDLDDLNEMDSEEMGMEAPLEFHDSVKNGEWYEKEMKAIKLMLETKRRLGL